VAVTPTYPGVYVEEVPSPVRTITGVSTAVTAFIGYTARGPTNTAKRLFNWGDYLREFGDLHRDSAVSYAVSQFFQNGGSDAYVVRVAAGAAAASVVVENGTQGGERAVLLVTAASQGLWGNNLRVEVDYDTVNPLDLFNLTVTELVTAGDVLVPGRVERHRNLTLAKGVANDAVEVVNNNSQLINLARDAGATGAIAANDRGTATSADLGASSAFPFADIANKRVGITVDGDGPHDLVLDAPTTYTALLTRIAAQAAAKGFAILADGLTASGNTTTTEANIRLLRFRSPTKGSDTAPPLDGEYSSLRFSPASRDDVTALLHLGVANGGTEVSNAAAMRPAPTGVQGATLPADIPAAISAPAEVFVDVLRNASTTASATSTIQVLAAAEPEPQSAEELRALLEQKLRLAATDAANVLLAEELGGARVLLEHGALRVVAGGTGDARFVFRNRSTTDKTAELVLGLTAGPAQNVPRYVLGTGSNVRGQAATVAGADGTPPNATEIRGLPVNHSGIYALDKVDIFNLLCIPRALARSTQADHQALVSAAMAYCEQRRAFFIVDVPVDIGTREEAVAWISDAATPKSKNAAAYFPWLMQGDPLQDYRPQAFPPCGALAGLYARTDGTRGVWKAPAGTEAFLSGPQDVVYKLSDPENGTINPLGLNAIRSLPVYGHVAWGARTLHGADQMASEWKYIPIRRTALFIEESLFRGTQWVVFEPNDEPLWSQIRLNVGAFMHSLFRQGAFEGNSPRDAYLVKCDSETTTADDRNRGIVNILVGFAPLKPAEFVILKITQLARASA
jgi:phage tail sheath protein FI